MTNNVFAYLWYLQLFFFVYLLCCIFEIITESSVCQFFNEQHYLETWLYRNSFVYGTYKVKKIVVI